MAIVEEKKIIKNEKPNILKDERGGLEIEKEIKEMELGIEVKDINSDTDIISAVEEINFKKVSKEKMFKVIVQLILENKKLTSYLNKYQNESEESFEKYEGVLRGKNSVEKEIHKLALKISPSYKRVKNSPKYINTNMNVHTMVDFIYKDFLSERKINQERQMEVLQERLDNKKILDDLTEKISRLEGSSNARTVEELNITEEELEQIEKETSVEDSVLQQKAENKLEMSESTQFILKSSKLPETIEKIPEDGSKIIQAIGEKGLSAQTDIIKYVSENHDISEGRIKTLINDLEKLEVLNTDIVNTFRIKTGFKVVELTKDLGVLVYKKIFLKNPVISEAEEIRRDHDNLSHGYSIKDVTDELNKLGYKEVSSNREENRVRVGQGRSWIPDITAINPTNNSREFFEVEIGTMSNDDFSEKLTKAKMKATTLKIIVPNILVKEKKKNQVENWIAESKDKTMLIYITTFQEFCKKEDGFLIKGMKN